jgi:hypothetical protein
MQSPKDLWVSPPNANGRMAATGSKSVNDEWEHVSMLVSDLLQRKAEILIRLNRAAEEIAGALRDLDGIDRLLRRLERRSSTSSSIGAPPRLGRCTVLMGEQSGAHRVGASPRPQPTRHPRPASSTSSLARGFFCGTTRQPFRLAARRRRLRVSRFRGLPRSATAPTRNCLDFGWRIRRLQ